MSNLERLRAACARLDAVGMPQKKQAELLGIYPSSLCRLISGRREPGLTVVLLAERVAAARRPQKPTCAECGDECDMGLEDTRGRAHCAACYDAVMEDWHEREIPCGDG